MANRDMPVGDLPRAERVTPEDLFVLEQNDAPKSLTAQVLENWLLELADGHGGIQKIEKVNTDGFRDTYRISLSDGTVFDFTVTNGRGVKGISKTGADGLVDTYTMEYSDGTTDTIKVTNGRGIAGITKTGSAGLEDTYAVGYNDGTSDTLKVTNGRSIVSISKTATSGLKDTYTIKYNDGTSSAFTVTNGDIGPQGLPWYVWIRYASQMPTEDSHSFGDIPDDYIGICSGNEPTAPTDYRSYKWYRFKGNDGLAPVLSIGTITTVEAGEEASATLTGTSLRPLLNLSIPKGKDGVTPRFSIGSITTVEADQEASANIIGSPEYPILNLAIPRGRDGADAKNAPDWSVNVSGGDGYIKNRTHYVVSEETLITEDTFAFDGSGVANAALPLTSEAGKKYRITWNGVDYFCETRDVTNLEDARTHAFGNMSLLYDSLPNSGEPFLFKYVPETLALTIISPASAGASVPVVLYYAEVVQKLDRKFVPSEWLATKTVTGVGGLIYPEAEVAFTSTVTTVSDFGAGKLDEGGMYTVYWNGTPYDLECHEYDGEFYLGNGALGNYPEEADAPFLLVGFAGAPGVMVFKETSDAETITLKVEGTQKVEYEKLPKEYLPDDVGGVNVTGATPGQLLLVKSVDENGMPTEWETVDRTHWKEVIKGDATFDGDLTGREYIDLTGDGTQILVKVSDEILTVTDLIGRTLVGSAYGADVPITLTEENTVDMSADGIPATIVFVENRAAVFCMQRDSTMEGIAGVYFLYLKDENGELFAKSLSGLTGDKVVYHKLDNKFLDLPYIPKKTVTVKELLPETELTGSTLRVEGMTQVNMAEGAKVWVTINGVEHESKVIDYGGVTKCFGNLGLIYANNVPDTGEPFVGIMLDPDYDGNFMCTEANATVSIKYEVFTYDTLPSEYAPASYIMPTDWSEYSSGEVATSEVHRAMDAIREGRSAFAYIDGVLCPVLGAHESDGYAFAFAVERFEVWRLASTFGNFKLTKVPFIVDTNSGNHFITAVANPSTAKVDQILRVKTVETQYEGGADGTAVEYEAVDQWVITSPSGKKFQITVDDAGNLTTTAVTE